MKISPLSISGAWEIAPVLHGDRRGLFLEWYSVDAITEAVGHPLRLAQANISVSARDVVRGIHYADGGTRSASTTPTGTPCTSRKGWATPSAR